MRAKPQVELEINKILKLIDSQAVFKKKSQGRLFRHSPSIDEKIASGVTNQTTSFTIVYL